MSKASKKLQRPIPYKANSSSSESEVESCDDHSNGTLSPTLSVLTTASEGSHRSTVCPPPGFAAMNNTNNEIFNADASSSGMRPVAPLTTEELLRLMLEQNQRRDEQMTMLLNTMAQTQIARPPQAEYQIMPDLNQSIPNYDGEGNSAKATSWLRAIETTATLHRWPEPFKLDSARTHLIGAATHWFNARSFNTWIDFTTQFRRSFMGGSSLPEKWKKMQQRVQAKGESTNVYFHEKVMLCQEVGLGFDDLKKQVAIGLWSKQLSGMLMARQHVDTDQLLEDIRSFEEVDKERNERIGLSFRKPTRSVPEPNWNANRYHVKQEKTPGSTENTVTSDKQNSYRTSRSVKCYNCGRHGHVSKDCSRPRRPLTCGNCGQEGHLKKSCDKPCRTVEVSALPSSSGQNVIINDSNVTNSPLTKLLKETIIKGTKVLSLVDTGSSSCTIQASAAIKCGLQIGPSFEVLRGFGNINLEPVKVLGETTTDIMIDEVVGRDVLLLVVPDNAQSVEVLIGRTYTELAYIAYVRIDDVFRFGYRNELPFKDLVIQEVNQTIRFNVVKDQELQSNCINFVQVLPEPRMGNDGRDIIIPVINESQKHIALAKGQYLDKICLSINDGSQQVATSPNSMNPLTLTELKVGTGIDHQQTEELLALVNEFRDCFATNLSELGCTHLATMDIKEKPGSGPIASRPYKTNAMERETIKSIVADWREHGIVTDTHSPYASPVLLVKKKTGEERLVVDYRRLNQQTVKDHYPLPNIDEQLELLSEAKLFTVLDLAHGYLQIPLSKEAKEKTAFITPDDTGQFERLMFGLTNGPSTFQRLMNRVLGPLRNTVALCYLDDLLIPAKDWADMMIKLRAVFNAFRKAKLTLKVSKCEFGKGKIEYLGFVISEGHIQPGPLKTEAIAKFPQPSNVHEVRRFLGLTSFFRRFMKHYAARAEPISRLTRKDQPFVWGHEQQEAFNDLKNAMASSPILALYNPNATTELHTDASCQGLAGMLLQQGADGRMHLIYCVSKKTNENEKHFHSSRLELMAIVWSVARLRGFLLGISFTIVTDCRSLIFMNEQRTQNPVIARMSDLLQEYDFVIKHRPGDSMPHVDALSRAPIEDDTNFDPAERLNVFVTLTMEDQVLMMQCGDVKLKELQQILNKPSKLRSAEERNKTKDVQLKNGLLFKSIRTDNKERLLFMIPASMRKSIVVKFHDLAGHFSLDRTIGKIQEHYWFGGMRRYVKQHIAQCVECLLHKIPSGKKPGLLHPIPPGKRPYETIHMDHLGPFVQSSRQNTELLVVIDNLTKFVHLFPARNTSAKYVLKSLKELVTQRGLPKNIISDRGTCFTSHAFDEYCLTNGISHILNATRHPRANGQVERVNRTVLPVIAMAMTDARQKDWDKHIKEIERWLNTSVNKTTGKTPFELLYGYLPRFDDGILREITDVAENEEYQSPNLLQQEARQEILLKQVKYKQHFDKKSFPGIKYDIGEIVVMRRAPAHTGEPTKLQPKFRGPLVVTTVLPADTYRVSQLHQESGGRFYSTTAHVSQLKPWNCKTQDDDDIEMDIQDDDDIEVDIQDDTEDTRETTADENDKVDTCENEIPSNESDSESDVSVQNVLAHARPRRRPTYLQDYVS